MEEMSEGLSGRASAAVVAILPTVLGFNPALLEQSARAVGLLNGGFEQPLCDPNNGGPDNTPRQEGPIQGYCYYVASNDAGWNSEKIVPSDPDPFIEIRYEDVSAGSNAFEPYQGLQYAELNANVESTLYQDVSGIAAGSFVGYQFAHRTRFDDVPGGDAMALIITDSLDGIFGNGDDVELINQQFSTPFSVGWRFYRGRLTTPVSGQTLRFAYQSRKGTDQTNGNFLDAVAFGTDAGLPPVPPPLPIFGAMAAFGFSRKVRRRLAAPQGQ
jgi:hypothetical protein